MADGYGEIFPRGLIFHFTPNSFPPDPILTLDSPSTFMPSVTEPAIPPVALDTITQHIGNTPLVRLNRLPRSLGIDATVYAKLEYFNAGGSVKDRIALRMIEEAERSGRIKPGDTLIEPTSGNTLVSLLVGIASRLN